MKMVKTMKLKLINDFEGSTYLDLIVCSILDQPEFEGMIEAELPNGEVKQLDDESKAKLINWSKKTIDKIDEYKDEITSYEIRNYTLNQIIDHAKSGKHLTREESDKIFDKLEEVSEFHFDFNDLISDMFLQLADRLENLKQESEKLMDTLESMQVKS